MPTNSAARPTALDAARSVCVCVRARVRACVRACVRAYVRECARAHLGRRGHRAPTYLERIVARTPPLSLATHGYPPPKSRPSSSLGAGPPTSTGLSPFKGTWPDTPATPGGEVREEWGGRGGSGRARYARACHSVRLGSVRSSVVSKR